jgi:hypothetical protein
VKFIKLVKYASILLTNAGIAMKKSLFLIAFFSLITSSAWAGKYYTDYVNYGYTRHNEQRNYYPRHSGNRYWRRASVPYYHHNNRPAYRYHYRDHGARVKIGIR